jgi:hypothetical protein
VGSALVLAGATALAAGSDTGPEAPVWFEEVAERAGIDFVHVRAMEMRWWLPEIMSGGVGWCDYDGDGRLDLYFVQGGAIEPGVPSAPGNRLFRNLGDGRFVDVTVEAGVGDQTYGQGLACGDFDTDGDVDIHVTNVGPNILYLNNGDGTFRDVAEAAGIADPVWGSSSALFDYDVDGDMDLFVVNYIIWSPSSIIECQQASGARDYCHPINYQTPARDRLYRNDGNGSFTDVSEESGINTAFGNGLGIGIGDFDGDGRLDVFVNNDANPNQLWINQGDGRFVDQGLISGCALNISGRAEAGMGVAPADVDSDDDLDLFLTHLRVETNTLFLNDGGFFDDATASAGLGVPSINRTGFGTAFHDFDHDGRLDLYVVNGRVGASEKEFVPGDPFSEPNMLFRQMGNGRFEEISPAGGTAVSFIESSRAAAFADYDDDGDVDLAIINNGGRARLLENVAVKRGSWVGFRVVDKWGREASGARVRLSAGGRTQWREAQSAYSYCAANDPRVHFGLGESPGADEVLVRWIDGTEERFGPYPAGSYHELRQGEGARPAP